MSAPPEPAPGPQHPSRLELDGLLVDAAAATPETRAHVAACAGCSAYLGGLRAMAEAPLPAPLLAHTRRTYETHRPLARLLRPALVAPSLAAVAALALLVLRPPGHETNGGHAPERAAQGVREKGGPRVVVYLQRGPTVWRWDEQALVRAGDRLRLEVAGAGHAHVTVVTPHGGEGTKDGSDGDRLRALYAGPLPERGAALLPASWQLDAEGRSETLFVLFSRAPLPESELRRDTLLRPELVVRKLVLRKE